MKSLKTLTLIGAAALTLSFTPAAQAGEVSLSTAFGGTAADGGVNAAVVTQVGTYFTTPNADNFAAIFTAAAAVLPTTLTSGDNAISRTEVETGKAGAVRLASGTFTITQTPGTGVGATNGPGTYPEGAGASNEGGAFYFKGGSLGIFTAAAGATLEFTKIYSGSSKSGGVIYNNGGTVILANTKFAMNRAHDGGAIYNVGASSNLIIADSLLSGNYATNNYGGAIYNNAGKVAISGTQFTGNMTSSFSQGNALYNSNGGTAILTDVTFSENHNGSGGQFGGAVTNSGIASTMTITNAVFSKNEFVGNGGGTGGALSNTGILNVTNASFSKNVSSATGGGAVTTSGSSTTATLTDVTFSDNHSNSLGDGGALRVISGSTATLTNAAFSGNYTTGNSSDGNGGAIYNAATVTLTNASFTGNFTGNDGGGTGYGNGGAIFNSGTVTLNDADFVGNHTSNSHDAKGGAIFNSGTLNITVSADKVSTFSGNTDSVGANSIVLEGGTLNITTAAGGVLDMQDPFRATTAATITKAGAGTWNLGGTSALNSTASAIAINEGTLHLYKNASISGSASTFTLAADATLSVSGGNSITTPTVTIGNNSTLAFDLSSATSGVALLTFTGGDGVSVGTGITVDVRSPNPTSADTYTLVAGADFGSYTFAAPTLRGETLAGRASSLFTAEPNGTGDGVTIVQSNVPVSGVVTWVGGSTDWSIAPTSWSGKDTSGAGITTFLHGDVVNFDNTSAGGTIVVNAGGVHAAGINFSGSKNYKFTTGALETDTTSTSFTPGGAVNGKLTLGAKADATTPAAPTLDTAAFSGTVDIANGAENTFTGGVDVFSGKLVLSAGSLLDVGESDVRVFSGAKLTVDAGSQVTTTGAGAVELDKNSTLTFAVLSASSYGQIFSNNIAVAGTIILNLDGGFAENAQIGLVLNLFRGANGSDTEVTEGGSIGGLGLGLYGGTPATSTSITDSAGKFSWELDLDTGKVTLTGVNVPEPSTYALFGAIGAVGLAILRRRKNKK